MLTHEDNLGNLPSGEQESSTPTPTLASTLAQTSTPSLTPTGPVNREILELLRGKEDLLNRICNGRTNEKPARQQN